MAKRIRVAEKALETWLEVLQESGVSLDEYGKVAARLVAEEFIYRRWDGPEWVLEVIMVDYGPEVHDWKIWWSEASDHFAGEFWEMVEPKPSLMPGSWVEDE